MSFVLTLTDQQLPISTAFADCLYRHLNGIEHRASWYDQVSEALTPRFELRNDVAPVVAESITSDPQGRQVILRSYDLFVALITGQVDKLQEVHERHRFICVVGCPRTGGSYLVKQAFQSLGIDGKTVPNLLAHDGFPTSNPFILSEGCNTHTHLMRSMAEYLALVELRFPDTTVVPKKATKAAYNGAFFAAAFGPQTKFIVTVRHPVMSCISTYEKAGGLPQGQFGPRSSIEDWMQRDNAFVGAKTDGDYFDVYLRYWEMYHANLALTGLAATKPTVIVYGKERMEGLAQQFHERFSGDGRVEEFAVFDKRGRHPEWERNAQPVIERTAALWETVGMKFPVDEIMEQW